jgi:hypothetical protein
MTDTQTRKVTTAVAKARETRKRMVQAGASAGEVALLEAVYDLHLRLERLERLAAQQQGRAEKQR